MRPFKSVVMTIVFASMFLGCRTNSTKTTASDNVYKIQQGFVDANGVMIYYEEIGKGEPLMIVHGGPGASHD